MHYCSALYTYGIKSMYVVSKGLSSAVKELRWCMYDATQMKNEAYVSRRPSPPLRGGCRHALLGALEQCQIVTVYVPIAKQGVQVVQPLLGEVKLLAIDHAFLYLYLLLLDQNPQSSSFLLLTLDKRSRP